MRQNTEQIFQNMRKAWVPKETNLNGLRAMFAIFAACLLLWNEFFLNQHSPFIYPALLVILWFFGQLTKKWQLVVSGLVLLVSIFLVEANSWKRGDYDRACPDYFVAVRENLNWGNRSNEIKEIEKVVVEDNLTSARDLLYKAQQRWGSRPEINEIERKVVKACAASLEKKGASAP